MLLIVKHMHKVNKSYVLRYNEHISVGWCPSHKKFRQPNRNIWVELGRVCALCHVTHAYVQYMIVKSIGKTYNMHVQSLNTAFPRGLGVHVSLREEN